jgi:hypothetical protein
MNFKNLRMYPFFYSIFRLSAALFFVILGIVCLLLAWSDTVRNHVIQFILDSSIAICLFGFAFLMVGLSVIVKIIFDTKHRYYEIKAPCKPISVDEAVIQDYLNAYWRDLFPQTVVPNQLTIKKNRIHLAADLPHIPLAEQKILLEKIKLDLSELFNSTFGYKDNFYLSLSFLPEQKNKVN